MALRPGYRTAVVAASLLALSLPATFAHAVAAAPPKNCDAYQKTVDRHQETVNALDEKAAQERQKEDQLFSALQDATAEADHIQFKIGDLNERLEYTDPASPEYAELPKEQDTARAELATAQQQERAAYQAWAADKPDAQLAADRTKAHQLLKRAQTRLATCQSQLAG